MRYPNRMRTASLALLAFGLLALPAQAEWTKMDGQAVPKISAKTWLNTKKGETPSVKMLRGKVYLLEFFATT